MDRPGNHIPQAAAGASAQVEAGLLAQVAAGVPARRAQVATGVSARRAHRGAKPIRMRPGLSILVACSALPLTTPMPARAQCYSTDHAKLIAGDATEGDEFGTSVAITEHTLVVGSWFDDDLGPWSGSAYVYRRDAMDWRFGQKLIAPNGASGDLFGTAVAADGDVIVVGSPHHDPNSLPDAGAAFVFERTGEHFQHVQTLLAGDRERRAWFGRSVAIRGDVIVVGAPLHDDASREDEKDHGAVYVFRRAEGLWQTEATLRASVSQHKSEFGSAVAISGPPGEETVLAGAPYFDLDEQLPDTGAAFIFERETGQWTGRALLLSDRPTAGDMFASAVALGHREAGPFAVVGAFGDDTRGEDAGAAFVFERIGAIWRREAKLLSAESVPGDWFGWSVATAVTEDATRVLVGASREDHACSDSGSAYVFEHVPGTDDWDEHAKVFAADTSEQAWFGSSVSASDQWAAIGASFDGAVGDRAGSVHVFHDLGACEVPRRRIRVDAHAPGGNGLSWELAFNELSDALAAARPGDVIQVAEGVYTPDRPGGDRSATFQLVSGITVIGGYGGYCADDPDGHDPENLVTILSGDLRRDDGPEFDRRSDNSFHVITGSGVDETAVVRDVIITGGHADDPDVAPGGGGLFNIEGHPTFVNCVFRDNLATARTSGEAFIGGGAVMNIGAHPRFMDCTFVGNAARRAASGNTLACGGAVYNLQGSAPIVRNCTFIENTGDDGGGMCNEMDSAPLVEDCVFSENHTRINRDGGGMYNGLRSHARVRRSLFERNTAGWGGGIRNQNDSNPEVSECVFIENETTANGGAILNYNRCSPLIERCVFYDNRGRDGGAIANGASSNATIRSCAIMRNVAGNYGGGVWNYLNSNPLVENCTIVDNDADLVGGVLSWDGSRPIIRNNILWNNSDPRGVIEDAQVWVNLEGIINVDYCCVSGWTGTYEGEGVFGADPLMIDPDGPTPDIRLHPDSPAINAGDPEFNPDPLSRDLAGNFRVLCDRVDIGAIEFGVGDYQCDRDVDLGDYEHWDDCMTGPEAGPYDSPCAPLDFDTDGDVDLADFGNLQIAMSPAP